LAKILVVDDAIFARMRLARLLTDNGYEVAEAANGAEALAKYKQWKPDAVLLDITLPDMDGLAALKQIIAHDPGARVAMMSAMGQKSMVVEALKVGAKDFIVKPFDAARVLPVVQKLVKTGEPST